MTKPHYTELHKLLHWASALVILWATLSGFYMSLFETPSTIKNQISFINVSLTTAYLPAFIIRMWISFAHYRKSRKAQISSADFFVLYIHASINIVVAIVLITGILMMDRAISVFDIVHIHQPLSDPFFITLFFKLHILACTILALMIFLHIAAVVRHEYKGHNVLHRMLFRGRNRECISKVNTI